MDSGNIPMSLPQNEWCHFCYKPCLSPRKSPALSHLRGCLRRVSKLSLLIGACLSVCLFLGSLVQQTSYKDPTQHAEPCVE